MATDKIYVQIDDEKIELTSDDKEAFVADREATAQAQAILETEAQAKAAARASALAKLADLGLTAEEIAAL